MSSLQKLWGYTAGGDAKVFLVPVGGQLPAGWSPDINVIADPALRDGTLLSEKAGRTIDEPEFVSSEHSEEAPAREHWKTRQKREREEAERAAMAEKPLRYDENLQQVID